MTLKIDKKIVRYSVVKLDEPTPAPGPDAMPAVQQMHESVARPDVLPGATYKVKTPLSEHALYVTINDYNGRPFEIFINSKAMEHFQWIVALTRMLSAVFRKGGDVTFIVEEMRSVFDPKGGKFMPSLVAEIGDIIERHCTDLGLIERDTSLAEATKAMVGEKLKNAGEKPERA